MECWMDASFLWHFERKRIYQANLFFWKKKKKNYTSETTKAKEWHPKHRKEIENGLQKMVFSFYISTWRKLAILLCLLPYVCFFFKKKEFDRMGGKKGGNTAGWKEPKAGEPGVLTYMWHAAFVLRAWKFFLSSFLIAFLIAVLPPFLLIPTILSPYPSPLTPFFTPFSFSPTCSLARLFLTIGSAHSREREKKKRKEKKLIILAAPKAASPY